MAPIFELAQASVVCYTAVFSVVTQRSSPLSGEEKKTENSCVADYSLCCKARVSAKPLI